MSRYQAQKATTAAIGNAPRSAADDGAQVVDEDERDPSTSARVAIAVDVLLTERPRPLVTASPTTKRNAVGTNLVLKVLVTSLAALRR
jgi:hypothetical protein